MLTLIMKDEVEH